MVKKRNRKSKKIELWKILIAILVVLVVVFFLLKDVGIFMGPETTNVTRVADHRIVGASEYVTINLGVVIGEGENSYAIEEIIPSGWNVFDGGGGNLLGDTLRWVVCGECVAGTTYGNPCYTNNGTEDILCCDEINSSGCWNYNGIDYEEGCCVMDIDADLSYIIQAPSTISGTNTYSLDGQFMFEDFTENATTFGQTEVYGSSDSIVTRQFSSSSIEVGDTIEVYLDVLIEGGETYYAIEEFVPAGFNVVDYGGGNTSDSHILKWANINISEDLNRGYSYNITALNSGDHSFYGNYSFENITGPITVYSTYGQDSVSVSGDSEICIDSDEDGYGVCPNCNLSNGCTFDGHDCDDDNSEINPGATEICGDGVDNDCSGEDLECPSCGEGQITSRCNCGGANYDSGYCCSDVWKGTACVSDILRSFNTSSANSYELINVSLNVIIYNDESHYVIEEFIPSCWNVVDAGIASLVENRLRWAVCGECGGGSVWGGICETYNGSEYIPCCDVINESGCWNNNGIGYEEGCCVWDIDADLSYIIQSAGITENAQFYGEYMYEGSSSNTTVGGQDTISINGLPAGCDSDGDCYYADNVTCNFGGDCDDSNPNVHPGATDICNGIDDDCNGFIDQGGDLLCDDGLHCNGIETCEGVLGCQSGTAPDCDDGVGCTDDSCNEATDSCDNIPNNANCDDGVVCNGTETCDSVLDCQAGIPVDCSGSDESEIDVCDYVPDGNPLTRDYRVTFTSQCQEPTGDCTEADDGDITHTCSISQCGAECEDSSDCLCPSDGCQGGPDFYDYPVNGNCNDCSCEDGTGGGEPCEPTITYNSPVCGTCSNDDDCNALDDDYCLGDRVMHSEGVCNSSWACEAVITEIEDCSSSDIINCSGTERWENNYTCNLDSCVISSNLLEDCDDGVFCNGAENCIAGSCVAGGVPDCSAEDQLEVGTCDNDPDNWPFTWDSAPFVAGYCDSGSDQCVEGIQIVTSTCSISSCGAECEDDTDCDDSDLSTTDTCLNNCSCINTFNCTDLDGDGYNITAECNWNGMPDCDVNNASRWVDTLYFYDSDGDGYGVSDNNITLCTDGGDIVGYSMIGGDCNDGDSNIHPGATEICGDGIDNDCSGSDASCPSTSSSSSSSSSSSGSGDDEGPSADFSLSVDTLILELRQGQSDQEEFVVTNNGSESLDFSLSYNSNMFFIPIRSFSLDVGESETVKVNFGLSEDQSPGTYMSAIMVNAGEIERRIAVAISVTSVDSLFDVKIEVPEEKVPAGEEVDIDVYLTRLVEMEGDNVSLIYSIKDEEGNEVYTESESLFVENSLEFVKKFLIPDHLKGGKYLVLARVEYGDKVAESSSWINVGKKAPALFLGFFVFITIVLVLVLVVVLIIRSKQNNISLRDVVKNATNTNSGSNSAPGNVTQVK